MDDLNRASPTAIGSLFDKYDAKLLDNRRTLEYEYEALCLENQDLYGRKFTWSLPWKKGVTTDVLREAFKIARNRGVADMVESNRRRYLLGIIKRLTSS